MSLLVDTDAYAVTDRASAVTAAFARASVPHAVEFFDAPDHVHTRVESWRLAPGLAVLRHESSGIAHVHDERGRGGEAPELVSVVLHEGSRGSYSLNGATRDLTWGSLCATELNSVYAYRRPGTGVAKVVMVERGLLGLTFEQVEDRGSRLEGSPLYGFVRSHIQSVCSNAGAIERSGRAEAVAASTAALLQDLLLTVPDIHPAAPVGALHAHLLDRLEYFIRLNFSSADLSMPRIAAVHNISTRYLHKVFAETSRSPMETLMTTRLRAARRMLAAEPSAPVEAIAIRCGFRNASHFSRRFRTEFGVSPSEWRREESVVRVP